MMSDDIRIFDKATTELLRMYNADSILEKRKACGRYSWAEQELEKFQQELAEYLPQEAAAKLNKLPDFFKAQEAAVGEMLYKQGFADGISLVMQSFMRQSSRK